jgi:hypothetical protein
MHEEAQMRVGVPQGELTLDVQNFFFHKNILEAIA